MTNRMGPQTSGQAHPTSSAYSLPPNLADVALIDAPTCAAAGAMSLSWWHDEVREGRAPKPLRFGPRCSRWKTADIRQYLIQRAEQPQVEAAVSVKARATKASAAAQAKRKATREAAIAEGKSA